jgi:hypothetical protein
MNRTQTGKKQEKKLSQNRVKPKKSSQTKKPIQTGFSLKN